MVANGLWVVGVRVNEPDRHERERRSTRDQRAHNACPHARTLPDPRPAKPTTSRPAFSPLREQVRVSTTQPSASVKSRKHFLAEESYLLDETR